MESMKAVARPIWSSRRSEARYEQVQLRDFGRRTPPGNGHHQRRICSKCTEGSWSQEFSCKESMEMTGDDKEFRRLLQPRIVFRLVPRGQAGWTAERHIRTHWLLQWRFGIPNGFGVYKDKVTQLIYIGFFKDGHPSGFGYIRDPALSHHFHLQTLQSGGQVDLERGQLTDGGHQAGCRLRVLPLGIQSCCFQ